MKFNGKRITILVNKMAIEKRLKPYDIRRMLMKKTGISKQTLSLWEHSGVMPEMKNLCAMAIFFNISVDFLFLSGKLK